MSIFRNLLVQQLMEIQVQVGINLAI